jgi:cyclopropane fatty-acyl-phospholipid synthase-like methyltransferase
MDHNEKIAEYYNHTEKDYKTIWHHKLTGPPALHFGYYDEKATRHGDAIRRVNEVLAELSEIKEGDRVLDAGCGLGQTSLWLATEKKAVTTGISIVKEQVEKAEAYAKEMKIPGVNFLQADFLNTAFDDESFDAVWAIESVCHAVDKSLFYKEAFRLLKPGGRLVMADSFRGARPLPEKNEKLLQQAFSGWQILDIDTPEEHRANAEKAGFKGIVIKDVSNNMMVSYRNIDRHVRNFLWLGHIMKWLGAVSKVRLDNAKSTGKQAKALKRGAFRYMHLLAVKP